MRALFVAVSMAAMLVLTFGVAWLLLFGAVWLTHVSPANLAQSTATRKSRALRVIANVVQTYL